MTSAPDKPKPRRRWWQYSLRTFFVLLTVFCVWFGWQVRRAAQQRHAVEAIHGSVIYDAPYGGGLHEQLLGFDFFHDVVRVDIYDPRSNDLTPLAQLSGLKTLNLFGVRINDLRPLAGLTRLETLDLRRTPIVDVRSLAGLSSLQILYLDDTKVRDLRPLAELSIRELQLSGTPVSDVSPLARLTSLRGLDLASTQVRDVNPLAKLKRLQ